ncbi:MAG: hypothetical protein ACREHG_03760 [Candidatus Saccharimonadales bacterium]
MLAVNEIQQGYANTLDIGGSRWAGTYAADAFDPYAYVGTTSVVPLAVLSAPPTYGQLDSAYYGGSGGANLASSVAKSNPMSPVHSPVVLTIVALVVGLYMFHWLFYKGRKL